MGILYTYTYAGKHQDTVTLTKEMIKYGLHHSHLEHLVSNPSQDRWTLPMPPSVQLYADLHGFLKRKRIPVNEIGMIYRSIDPELHQSTTSNKEAHAKVQGMISKRFDSKDDLQSDSENEILSCDESTKPGQYAVRNVKCREKCPKARIENLQRSVRYKKDKQTSA